MFQKKRILIFIFAVLPAFVSISDDSQANDSIKLAVDAAKKGEYYDAAEYYMDARLYADDPVLKANSIKKAASAYRKAGYLYEEFQCLQRLIKSFPGYINYTDTVQREFEIGNEYFEGHRDPEFRWFFKWIEGEDKTSEIYRTALKNAPYSPYAPETRLRYGRLCVENDKIDEGLKSLRKTIKMYPDTKAQKYAYLELANALVQLAEYGDGDGRYGNEAIKTLTEFREKYPDDVENRWIKRKILELTDITAEKYYKLAEFYNERGRAEVAERYLGKVIRKYPTAENIKKTEQLLSEIDKTYEIPDQEMKRDEPEPFKMKEMISEKKEVLTIPSNSNGKWLLPVYKIENPVDKSVDQAVKKAYADLKKDIEKKEKMKDLKVKKLKKKWAEENDSELIDSKQKKESNE